MRITKLLPSTKIQGRWLCCLEDDSILRVGENEVVAFGLYSGMELTEDLRRELEEAVRRSDVRERALDRIAARPMSRKELVEKLTARPRDPKKPAIPTEDAEAAADWLEGLGYLNDAEYAQTVARHYSAKGFGPRKVRDELFKRGVPRAYWDAALEEAEAPGDGIDAFIRQKLRGRQPDARELKRVSDALARRGYRWEDIKSGLRRYGAELEEE